MSPIFSPNVLEWDLFGLSEWDHPHWVNAAILVLWIPFGFRGTCYYMRRVYYRTFFASPVACWVDEPDINKKLGYISRTGKGKVTGAKRLSEKNPELTELVSSYRRKIDRKTHKPLSFRTISKLLQQEHNLFVSHNSVQRILDDVVMMRREERNRKRRKVA